MARDILVLAKTTASCIQTEERFDSCGRCCSQVFSLLYVVHTPPVETKRQHSSQEE